MKIERLLLGLFASFLMVGCSQNDDLPNGGEEAKGKDSYISIKINSDVTGSRTADGFEEGTGKENKVNHVHFFFFDDLGQAFNVPVPTATTADEGTAVLNNIVQEGSAYNYIKATGMTETTQTGSVEKILDAVIVFKVQNSIYPSSVIAVLNWDYSGEGLNKQALMDKLIEETTAITTDDSNKGFIMSNSVYKSSDWQNTLDATEISSANFAATPADATTDAKAVKIYVERLAVKVTATVDEDADDYLNVGTDASPIHVFKVADAPDVDDNTGTDIYARLLTWDINTTAETSNLVKHLDAAWNETNPYSGWNDYSKFRSYFAVPATQQSYNSQFTWSDIPNEFGVADYCLENTSTTHPTNILVKAQLGTVSNSTFTPQTIYQWYSVYYTSLDDLKAAVKDAVDEQITLDVDNISITPLYDNTNPDAYLAYQVKIGVATGDYLKPGSTTDKLTSEEIAAIFNGIPTAKVWTNGATYYFTKIQHYDNPQINAVIRNHAYRVSIEGVKGLGTPVYTPEGDDGEEPEPIIPEPVLPEETETYIAAKINVLSWKIVNNNVVLGQ